MQKSQAIPTEEYLASQDVMRSIRISRRTLERYVADGKLPVSYLPSGQRRYLKADVEALITKASHIAPEAVAS